MTNKGINSVNGLKIKKTANILTVFSLLIFIEKNR